MSARRTITQDHVMRCTEEVILDRAIRRPKILTRNLSDGKELAMKSRESVPGMGHGPHPVCRTKLGMVGGEKEGKRGSR